MSRRWERHGAARGGTVTPEYRAYSEMIRRCTDPKRPRFANYGGRGIAVCVRWRKSFKAFLADVGERPSARHSLERTNNARGYYPSNVVWALPKQQQRNTRSNVVLRFRGEHRTMAEWAERLRLPYDLVKRRLRIGWSSTRALTTPVDHRKTGRPARIPAATVRKIRRLHAAGTRIHVLARKFKVSRPYIGALVAHSTLRKEAS